MTFWQIRTKTRLHGFRPIRPDDLYGSLGSMTYQDPDVIRRLLTETDRWAIVGLSSNRERAAHTISAFLKRVLDKEIVPVHPKAETVHGETGYASLAAEPGDIELGAIIVRPPWAAA